MIAPAPEHGIMIAVVGPSGAGKDSLINLARTHYRNDPRIGFVQRIITRPADGATEDHVPVSLKDFDAFEREGRFAVTWGAHGLRYGIPAATLDEIATGKALIANGSRAALERFCEVYSAFAVLEITARPEVIATRLAQRGRESAREIEQRLARDTGDWRPDCPHVQVDNSGTLEEAAQRLYAAIEALATARSSATSLWAFE
jgi:ribose 1,5-bisphosphokinase